MNTSFLSSLPNIDETKLNRLKNRLVTKDSSVSFNSLPLFTGYQEFYKEFIVTAANYIFNSYLRDIFISEIIELSEIKFFPVDFEESDESSKYLSMVATRFYTSWFVYKKMSLLLVC